MSLVRYLGYLRLYTNTPPRFHVAKPNGIGRTMGDGRRDPKKRLGKGPKRTESNNQLRNTREKIREEIFQRKVPKTINTTPPPKPIQQIDWEREVDDAGKYDVVGTCVACASTEEEEVLAYGMDGCSLPLKYEEFHHQM